MKKNLKLVGLLVLFTVLVVVLFYFVLPIRSTCLDECPGKIASTGNRGSFFWGLFVLAIIAVFLGKIIFMLTDLVAEVNSLFSVFFIALMLTLGGYLMTSNIFPTLPFAGGIITFFMSLLLMRTCLIWQSRRAVKKN
jgi:hypothetical protein